MRLAYVIFLLFGFYGSNWACAQQLNIPATGTATITLQVPCVTCVAPVPVQPPVIYQPVVQYQPLYYQGSYITEKRYHTPVRNALFGRYRGYSIYSPYPVGAQ